MSPRLRSDVLVPSILRTVSSCLGFAYVRHRGEAEGGIVHLVIHDGNDSRLFVETRDAAGNLAWRLRKGPITGAEAEAAIDRERDFDRDLWVVEIEGGVTIDDLPGNGVVKG